MDGGPRRSSWNRSSGKTPLRFGPHWSKLTLDIAWACKSPSKRMFCCCHSWRNLCRSWQPRGSETSLLAPLQGALLCYTLPAPLQGLIVQPRLLVEPQLSILFLLWENLFNLDFLLPILVSYGYSNKLSQAKWLKQQKIICLQFEMTKVQNQGYWQGCFLLLPLRGKSVQCLFPASGGC